MTLKGDPNPVRRHPIQIGELTGIASPELMQKVTRAADYRQWTRDFLGGE